MQAHLRLIRVGNVVVSFLGTVVGGLVARGAGLPIDPAFLATLALAGLSTACVTAGGNVLNDLGDRESDRTNHPDRPLVTGAISVRSAKLLVIGLLVASAALIVPIVLLRPLLAVILAAALGALLLYEGWAKSEGLPGNALVAFLTAAVFLYGGAAAGNALLLVPFAAMAFAATLSREIIKDMEDAAGDLDRRTFPRVHGMGPSALASRLATGVALLLSPVPFATFLAVGSVAGIIYLALVLLADALFVASVARLPNRLHDEQQLSKLAMTVAILAFLAAAFR